MLELAELSAKRARHDTPGSSNPFLSEHKIVRDTETETSAFIESSIQPARLHLDINPDPYLQAVGEKLRPNSLDLSSDWLIGRSKSGRLNISLIGDDSEKKRELETPNRFETQHSWDEIDAVSHLDPNRTLDYGPESRRIVISAAANAALGFHSDLMVWDPQTMRFVLKQDIQASSLVGYLESFAHSGSLIRRLVQACIDIRQRIENPDSRVVAALAHAVEKEVNAIQVQSDFTHETHLLKFASAFQQTATVIETLAHIVGCSGSRGRLTRVPDAVELIERAYARASAMDSEILWRLAVSCISPWLEQLNFVVGFVDPLSIRANASHVKKSFFPDIFIDFRQDSASLSEHEVPSFMPLNVAKASLECYKLLCLLGMKGPEALRGVALSPVSTYKLVHRAAVQHRLLDSSDSRSAGQSRSGSSMTSGPLTFLNAVDEPVHKKPLSVHHEIRKVFNPISSQYVYLNRFAKDEFRKELDGFREIVLGLYLLHDGWFWSQLVDLVHSAFKEQGAAAPGTMLAINELVHSRFAEHASIIAGPNGLTIKYEPVPIIRAVFGANLLQQYQHVFSRIIRLSSEGKSRELAILGTDIDTACRRIDEALDCPAAGLQEAISAFARASEL